MKKISLIAGKAGLGNENCTQEPLFHIFLPNSRPGFALGQGCMGKGEDPVGGFERPEVCALFNT